MLTRTKLILATLFAILGSTAVIYEQLQSEIQIATVLIAVVFVINNLLPILAQYTPKYQQTLYITVFTLIELGYIDTFTTIIVD